MALVLIALGSNQNQEQSLPAAIRRLRTERHLSVLAVSSIYRTALINSAGAVADGPSFYNAAVMVATDWSPAVLRTFLRQIESALGRIRSEDKFAPRPIDLDIEFYGQDTLDVAGSHIPNPDIMRYAHVAIPLAEIAPNWIHPETGLSLSQIASQLANTNMEIHKV